MRNEMESAAFRHSGRTPSRGRSPFWSKSGGGRLHELNKTVIRKSKRLGRGVGSGKGGTSGRGTKGQKSRSGYNLPRRFEGGQTPLIARLPKTAGFKSRKAKPQILSIQKIEKVYKDGETVSFKTLLEKGLISDTLTGVKILGPGKLAKKLKFQDVKLTKKLLADAKGLKKSQKIEKEPTTVSS